MTGKRKLPRKKKTTQGRPATRSIKVGINKEQRDYILGVRRWLNASLENKKKIIGGPI